MEAESSNTPAEINFVKLIQVRAMEISDLMFALETDKSRELGPAESGSRRTTFIQRLPRHMRRRAMAHNVKRVPRRLRSLAVRATANTKPRQKPPNRKYRRRPSNILQEFVSRQARARWLETHVWHAKRFHIREMWGYKIPWERTQRGFRAAYRDARTHCVMQDISYMSCIQLQGQQGTLLSGLNRLCSAKVGKTFSSVGTLTGTREGRVTLYRPNSYPFDCLGPCTFLFMPAEQTGEEARRVIWLWVHPTIEVPLIDSLTSIFSLKEVSRADPADSKHCSFDSFVLSKMASGRTFRSVEVQRPIDQSAVQLTLLNGSVLRFRLTGLTSSTVLQKALALFERDAAEPTSEKNEASYCKELLNRTKFDMSAQKRIWKWCLAEDSTNVADGTVFAMLIQDPRLRRRTVLQEVIPLETTPSLGTTPMCTEMPLVPLSPIWDECYRMELLKWRLTDKRLNELKSRCITSTEAIRCDSAIPILLVRRSGCCRPGQVLGLSGGWDVIVPGGWGTSTWVALHYANGRAVGCNFSHCLALECGTFMFPDDWPDTPAGSTCAQEQRNELMDAYMRKPPNRRPDFLAANVQFPFFCPWNALCRSWDQSYSDSSSTVAVVPADRPSYYVVRDFRILHSLVDWFSARGSPIASLRLTVDCASQALVPFRLEAMGKGTLRPFSMICLPSDEDWKNYQTNHALKLCEPLISTTDGAGSDSEAAAPCDNTLDIEDGEESLEEHEVDLDELFPPENRTGRMRKKRRKANVPRDDDDRRPKFDWDSRLFEQKFSRPVIGFVIKGGHSLSKAKNVATGFCSLAALRKLIDLPPKQRNFVLFRNPTSAVYRTAHLTVAYCAD